MKIIPVFKPLIDKEEISAAVKSLEVGWLGMGTSVGEFEQELKNFLGLDNKYVVAVATGHAALHLSMMLIGLGPGDEVITPSFNNAADFQAILAVGAEPVFCDIYDNTLCIDISKAEKLISPKTKAIIAMDYNCCLADHDALSSLATQYNLRIIHDAAHSFGSYYKNKKIGTFSDITMFSFDPVKTITCIDGGALIVNTKEEVKLLHESRLIGMEQSASVMYQNKRTWNYDISRLGFRYHMANLHAAIGLSQLKRMSTITESRQLACTLYNKLLSNIVNVKTPNTSFKDTTPFLYYIRIPKESRQPLRDYLKVQGIDTGIHWQPGHLFSLFKDYQRGNLTVTDRISEEILSLPLHSCMDSSLIEYISSSIKNYFKNNNYE